jgi:23S rRNA (adenine2030-N6)-methyltransferase
MLSYQHGYHAGNFADVIKHVTLTRLLGYLIQKDKPLFYLETHAGRGMYDLSNQQALKTNEALHGVHRIWEKRDTLPAVFSPYLQTIQQVNPDNTLRYYPGSPQIALQMLRSQDRLYCCELHPTEFTHLQRMRRHNKRIFYNHTDGFDQLHALLPPPERRGLIFIDPSYEVKTTYRHIPVVLKKAYQHFATGMYCLWYPLLDNLLHESLIHGLRRIDAPKHLHVEFYLSAPTETGMYGCGLWILNPPFVFQGEITEILNRCCQLLNPGKSSYSVSSE